MRSWGFGRTPSSLPLLKTTAPRRPTALQSVKWGPGDLLPSGPREELRGPGRAGPLGNGMPNQEQLFLVARKMSPARTLLWAESLERVCPRI